MSYTKFSDHYNWATDDIITATRLNYNADGTQSEFEDRMEASLLNGVISGFAPSVDATNIDIASGEAYVEGKHYSGASSVDFTGKGSGDFYVYIDPTDDGTPYEAKTSAPTTGEMLICTVTWDGSSLLSTMLDKREWGTVPWHAGQFVSGSVNTGAVGFYIMPFDIWLEDIKISCQSIPTANDVIVDLHAGSAGATPSTVFTKTSYRPTFATTDTAYDVKTNTGYIQVNRKLSAGDIIEIYIDQADASSAAANLTFEIRGRIYGKSS